MEGMRKRLCGRMPATMLARVVCILMGLTGVCPAQHYDFGYFAPVGVGNGARALAMGGACVAAADDGSAAAANPAVLTRIRSAQALIAGRFTFGALSLRPRSALPTDVSLESSLSSNLAPEFVGVTFPLSTVRRQITGALAVRGILDLNRSILFRRLVGREQPIQNYRDIEQTSSGGLYALSAALGAELSSRLSAGVAANFLSGRHRVEWVDRSASAGIEHEDGRWRRDNKFSGFSLDVGASARVSRFLDLGFKLSLPHTLAIVHPSYSTGGDDSTAADLNLKVPAFFTLGAAISPVQHLRLAVDYHLAPWSQAKVDTAIAVPGLPLPDAHSVHVGMEYRLPVKGLMVPLRLGFHTDPRLERQFSADVPSRRGDAIGGIAFTAGAGIQSPSMNFELSVDFGCSDYTGRNVFVEQAEGWSVKERNVRVIFAAAVRVQ